MKNVVTLFCLLVTFVAGAQFVGPGYYRVHNVYTDAYIGIKGTHFEKTTYPDAFWPCIKMLTDSAQVSDPGTIIYIDHIGEDCDLAGQGVSTYELTRLMMTVEPAAVMEGGKDTYIARTYYEYMVDGQLVAIDCIFRDMGYGLQAGNKEKQHSRWWIEPINESTMDTYYFGVKPENEDVVDADGWYWTSLCCDFPVVIPAEGGVQGAYTVTEVECGDDNTYYAEPELLYGQGEIIPASTPVLLKCQYPYASGNKLIPVGEIASNTSLPVVHNLLMGNYFSSFVNYGDVQDFTVTTEYIPEQATPASDTNMALGVDENGRLGFFPQKAGTYMAANTAWLSIASIGPSKGLDAVYLVVHEHAEGPVVIPGDGNGDGVMDINDITFLIDFILGGGDSSSVPGADANGDGKVDVTDLTTLIDMVLTRF